MREDVGERAKGCRRLNTIRVGTRETRDDNDELRKE